MIKDKATINRLIGKYAKEFIESFDYFSQENAVREILDPKHKVILENHYKNFDIEKNFNFESFRNWTHQNDLGVPVQVRELFKISKKLPKKIIKFFLDNTIFLFQTKLSRQALFDDLDQIIQFDAGNLLKENPVIETPGSSIAYNKAGYSFNLRWLRYIYLCKRILDLQLPKDFAWVDVGSYYGGLQGLVLKYRQDAKIVLVDFNHQLCRSYIYLKLMYPNHNFVLPDKIDNNFSIDKLAPGSIVFIPLDKYKCLQLGNFDLTSNFFSFGEMQTEVFLQYLNSEVFKNSKYQYLVNRFVSGPFFEKTYPNETNIFHYITANRDRVYFDIFPINRTVLARVNTLFGSSYKPISSQYFEMITKLV
jgi:putative sugar O-methyltransferase